ncbi:MAG: efflux RND transporter permease subunit [Sphingomonadales bacterium]|nr:efflux RND transporter permease subunit [Sphingomonadales bacterium]
MVLSDVSVKRPVFALVMSLLLVAFGALAFTQLPLREFPDTDAPIVSVSVQYPGASAEVIESRITQLIEDRISGIEGIRSIQSTSEDGRSRIVIEFSLERDIDAAANDVREAVARIVDNLPEEAEAPQITKADTDSRAIMWFNLTSNVMDELQLTDYAERNIVDRLSVAEGVASIRVGGRKRYAMRIWADPLALAARDLTVDDVITTLRAENVELPAGRVESSQRDFTVRVERGYQKPEDFARLVLGEGADGHLIRLGEVARIAVEAEDQRSEFRGNGQTQIGLGIIKQSNANTLSTAWAVKAEAEKVREGLPESMSLLDSWDSSIFIEGAVEEVYRTLFIAVGLVIFVIYLFLGSVRAALVPAATVPVCLTATFIVLSMFGYSLNLLTLLALVLAIGLVVDDAIVVLENVYRRVENGEPKLLAAYRGAKQVGFAVIATTMVLIGVFVPIIFLEGNTGKLFGELALTLSAAVAFSSFVALSLSPMMCSKLLSRASSRSWLNRKMDAGFNIVGDRYLRALDACFENKTAVGAGLLLALAMVFMLAQRIPGELTPLEDRGGFFVMMRGPEGAGFEYMREQVAEVEEKLMPMLDSGDVRRVLLRVPGFGSGESVNTAFGIIVLEKWGARDRSAAELVAEAQQRLKDVSGISPFVGQFRGLAGGSNDPVNFVVGGDTYEELAQFRDILMEKASAEPMFVNLDTDYRETKPQLRIEIDRDRAADLGVSVEQIGRTLETFLGGRRTTTYIDRGEEYNVIVRAEVADREQASDISNFYVRSERGGELIPLSNLVRITEYASAGELQRYNRRRAVTLTAGVAEGYTLGQALAFLEETVREELPASASVDYKGESLDFKEAGSAVYFTFLLALLVVFLILAAQFESFVHPLVIMLTVPLAMVGGLLGLYFTGSTLNIYSQIGIIILVGLASKNGILIVEFANQLRDAGQEFKDALMNAARIRLRPIIMTGLSTSAGALPLVLAAGPGSNSRGSIGIVIVTGVLFATLFTLFVVPVFYMVLARRTKSPGAIEAELKAIEAGAVPTAPGTPAE